MMPELEELVVLKKEMSQNKSQGRYDGVLEEVFNSYIHKRVKEIVAKYPNDADLGEQVRKLINDWSEWRK